MAISLSTYKISESSLTKAEFYNVDLGDGGELALGNSYIAECLFIGFNWNIKYKLRVNRRKSQP